jgi:hypothetical protein
MNQTFGPDQTDPSNAIFMPRQARLGPTPARLLPRADAPPDGRPLRDAGTHQGRRDRACAFAQKEPSQETPPYDRIRRNPIARTTRGWRSRWRRSTSLPRGGASRPPDGQQTAAAVKAEGSIASGMCDAAGDSRNVDRNAQRSPFRVRCERDAGSREPVRRRERSLPHRA